MVSWQNWVVPGAATVAGLGASAWLIYLDYRRRSPSPEAPEAPRARAWWSRPYVGPALVGGGVVAAWLTGGKSGWPAVGCYVPALIGLALMAAHATRSLARGSERGRGEDRRQD
ncbi:MAG TPA: hypothetical protein VGR67_04275 [Candidatus Polarisedimenticolia bacterium]|jgi:hypothetical protein|nr:hypothetical protein [Candidatus Polarisedimenticolia bacterium]